MTQTIIRLLKWALGIIAAGAMFAIATAEGDPSHASPMARIQRRRVPEAATAINAVGELTYSVEAPGEATLRVGTSDSGTVVVGDPCAIHIAPRRKLLPEEYSIRVSGAHTTNPDGPIVLATNVLDVVVTNTVAVTPVDPAVKISSVSWDLETEGRQLIPRSEMYGRSEDAATLTVAVTSQPRIMGQPPEPGMALLRGVDVWAWTTDRRSVELDAETHPLPFRDALGSTSLWDLRAWVTNRYDGRTAEHWSEFPATDTVRLAGQSVHYSAGGSLRSTVEAGAWTYYADGVPVIRVESGGGSADDELRILAIDLEGTNALIYVSASLGVPVYIHSAATVDGPYTRAAGQTSTYPATVPVPDAAHSAPALRGLPSYLVTVPIDPSAQAAFYRATATVDGGTENRALRLGGDSTALYIDGVRAAWTNITVGGATLRVLAAQPE